MRFRPPWKDEVTTIEETLGWGNIYISTTGNVDIITLPHMEKMKTRPSWPTSVISITKFRSIA